MNLNGFKSSGAFGGGGHATIKNSSTGTEISFSGTGTSIGNPGEKEFIRITEMYAINDGTSGTYSPDRLDLGHGFFEAHLLTSNSIQIYGPIFSYRVGGWVATANSDDGMNPLTSLDGALGKPVKVSNTRGYPCTIWVKYLVMTYE